MEHLHDFEENGFSLSVDHAAPCGRKVKLTAVPFSKSVQFGADDVIELASMIADGSSNGGDGDAFSVMGAASAVEGRTDKKYLVLKNDAVGSRQKNRRSKYQLPKVVAMFASRACRTAVMIGTALKEQEMRAILDKLPHVEQPWNCPHGRPTVRHLVDLRSYFGPSDSPASALSLH